jgi:nicotinamidase-related amidase
MSDYVGPDWANAALLTIDVQRDATLPGAPIEIPGTMEALPGIRQLVQLFRLQNKPIVHVVRIYRPDGSNVDLCRRKDIERGKRVMLPGSDGVELVDELKPSSRTRLDAERLLSGDLQPIGPEEWVMYKPRWGAFYQTPLEEHLRDLRANTVVVCGCNFPNCPRAKIYEASERALRVAFVADATSGVYERGLRELENIGVKLVSVDELSQKLTAEFSNA